MGFGYWHWSADAVTNCVVCVNTVARGGISAVATPMTMARVASSAVLSNCDETAVPSLMKYPPGRPSSAPAANETPYAPSHNVLVPEPFVWIDEGTDVPAIATNLWR